ncbi:MAG: hypothetical protein JRH03_07215 [Deltaproteobacteria bacterium]|nr:hypothetical protein [Deltaproteobacteria bacterium]
MPIDEVKKVCFVGAGTMGCYNSMISALSDYSVALYDISEEALEQVFERQTNWGEVLVESGIADHKRVQAASAAIIRTTDPEKAARDADFLSESVFERLDVKRRTHQQFDALLPPHAIMTTNTSTLLLSKIESAVKRGDKFAAMHFHQPTPLVDIVPGPRTSPRTMDIIRRFVQSQGQTYVELKKEREGYLHNTMFGALLGTAQALAALVGADFKEIDRSWMLNQNDTIGPFGMLDGVGLNLVKDVLAESVNREKSPSSPEIVAALAAYLQPYLDRDNLGMKTGRGFYAYPLPEFQKPEFLANRKEDTTLSIPMINTVLASALTLVAEGYADPRDVDKSWMLTHNPKCGPFGTMDAIGLDVVKKDLLEHAEQIEAMLGNTGTVIETTKIATNFLNLYVEKGELGVKTGKGFYGYPDPEYKKSEFLGGQQT